MTELEELKALAKERGDNYFGIDYLPESWEDVEEGNWEQEGKYQYCTSIVSKNGKYFAINQSRSGSYHTDWWYNEPEVYEVERKEKVVTTIEWIPI